MEAETTASLALVQHNLQWLFKVRNYCALFLIDRSIVPEHKDE